MTYKFVLRYQHSQTFKNSSTTSSASNLCFIVRLNIKVRQFNIVRYGRPWTAPEVEFSVFLPWPCRLVMLSRRRSTAIKKLVAQRIMVRTTSRSDRPWSAIFCVIVYLSTVRTREIETTFSKTVTCKFLQPKNYLTDLTC